MSKSRKNTIYYKLAKKICDKHNMPEDTKYLAMFIDMSMFQVYETTFIMSIAFMLGVVPESILAMLFFILARVGRKGVHMPEMWQCFIVSTILIIGLALISSFIIWWLAIPLGYIAGVVLRKKKNRLG
jgi:accessory gene regulator protein AgrB